MTVTHKDNRKHELAERRTQTKIWDHTKGVPVSIGALFFFSVLTTLIMVGAVGLWWLAIVTLATFVGATTGTVVKVRQQRNARRLLDADAFRHDPPGAPRSHCMRRERGRVLFEVW